MTHATQGGGPGHAAAGRRLSIRTRTGSFRAGARRAGPGAWALVAALGLGSCVTNEEYQQAVDLAKKYQTDLLNREAEVQRLGYENERLRGMADEATIRGLDRDLVGPVEARLDELAGLLDKVEGPIQDVMRFDVDGGYLFMIQDKLLFESGSADLGTEGRAALQGISRQIAAAPHGTIFVRGHTDSDPVKKPETMKRFPLGNIQLSAERAVAVAALLAETKDIPAKDICVMGFGAHRPVAANDNTRNKQLNRRVEIFVAEAGR